MTSRDFARVIGILFLAVGVLGFVPGLKSPPPLAAPHLSVEGGYGLLLGLFAVNWIHNLVHVAIGVASLRASHSISASRKFARGLTIFYGGLAVMGVIPVLNSTFGLIPLFGHDIWLHAGTAAVAAYFGFGQRAEKMEIRERYRRAA
ncbi:MAG TPA: DUF4383 domain-containing protein [Nitrospira sp.]|nr:DUF4383 domain-containing protein [Nitrospira sp.]